MAACTRLFIQSALKDSKLSIAEIALFGVLAALTFGAKMVMSGLPNIEPVSLMVMIFAVVFACSVKISGSVCVRLSSRKTTISHELRG